MALAVVLRSGWVAGWVALAAALASCTTSETVIRPVIDVPVDDNDATASSLDAITLRIAHAGNASDIRAVRFERGEPLEIASLPSGDDLVLHMEGNVGTGRPVAYGRTCAFSVPLGPDDPAPHLYFSRNVKFGSLGIAPTPRLDGLGISFRGGALLIGGNDGAAGGPGLLTQVERFDPLTGALTAAPFTVMPRAGAVQAQYGTRQPQVVVIGGNMGTDGAKFIELLDDENYSRLEFTGMARVGLTATSLSDGNVVVIGGREPNLAPVGDISLITQTNEMLDVQTLPKLQFPRSGHTATRLGADASAPVLIAGGLDDQDRPVADAELFKPLSRALATSFKVQMQIPRQGHMATLMPDGSVLIIGGFDLAGMPVASIERFSIDGGFTEAATLRSAGEQIGLLDFAATVLPDGRILLTGGRESVGGPPLDTAHIIQLNPLGGMVDVVPTDRLASARAGHQAVALCDGTVLVTGGTGGQAPAERYNPPPDNRR